MKKTFQDVLTIKNGKNQRAVENPKGKYPIYGSGGIMGRADSFICEAGSVVVGRKGSINHPIYVDEPFWNVDTAFGLIPDPKVLLPRFLYYFCLKYDFLQLNKAVTIPSLTKTDLLKIQIDIPDLSTQNRIIDKLQTAEKVICLRQQQLTELDNLIKARFVEMFGMSKEHKYLKDYVVLITKGASPKWQGVDYCEKGTLFITSENVRDGYLDLSKKKYLDDEINEIQSRSILKRNDILINIVGASIGRAAVYDHDELANINQAVALVRVDYTRVNQTYLMTFLNSPQAMEMYSKMKKGGARDNLSLQNIADLQVPAAPLNAQNQFAAFVAQVDKSKVVAERDLCLQIVCYTNYFIFSMNRLLLRRCFL